MSEKTLLNPESQGLDKRTGNSRKLLSRKAREKARIASEASLESCFPTTSTASHNLIPAVAEKEPGNAKSSASALAATALPVASCRHTRADLRLRPGGITPNGGTVVFAIVRLVVERGEVGRAELIDLMSEASFDHPKARAAEKGWSQGYVAGAIRGGFLAVAVEPSTLVPIAVAAEECQPC